MNREDHTLSLVSPKVVILLRVKHQSKNWAWSHGDVTVVQVPALCLLEHMCSLMECYHATCA